MKITEKQDTEHYLTYVIVVTAGELMALWRPLEAQRIRGTLSRVGYDCWLQLNRTMSSIAPELVKEAK